MQDNQLPEGKDTKEGKLAAGNTTKEGYPQPASKEEEEGYDRQKEEWQRGISAGEHEKMNANDGSNPGANPNRSGSSSIPLDKNDTLGNP